MRPSSIDRFRASVGVDLAVLQSRGTRCVPLQYTPKVGAQISENPISADEAFEAPKAPNPEWTQRVSGFTKVQRLGFRCSHGFSNKVSEIRA